MIRKRRTFRATNGTAFFMPKLLRVVQAPQEYKWWENGGLHSVFIGGGISNCPDWQSSFLEWFHCDEIIAVNPRRKVFNIKDPSIAKRQILWEYVAIEHSDIVVFWFCKETLCPITLLELGTLMYRPDKKLFVGIDPDYQRRIDVEMQLALARPDVRPVYSLRDLAGSVRLYTGKDTIAYEY